MFGLFNSAPDANAQDVGGIVSPETVKAKRALARALMEKATDTSPVKHWLQGAARIGQAIQGSVEDYYATRDEKAGQKAFSDAFSGLTGVAPSQIAPPQAQQPTVADPSAGNVNSGFIAGIDNRYTPQEARQQLAAWGDAGKIDLSGMTDQKAVRLASFLEDNPHENEISITSAYRSPEKQAQLYANRANNPYPVAPPGKSRHNSGEAADLAFGVPEAQQWAHSNAAKYGLAFPHANDPIHVELAGGQALSAPASAAPAQPAGGDASEKVNRLAKIIGSPAYAYANEGQKAVINAMYQRALAQQEKDPNDAKLKALQVKKAERDLNDNSMETQVIGGNLYERKKGTSEPWKLAVKKADDDATPKRSLVPIYGTDENGSTVLLQPDDKGNANQMKLPPGVKVSSGIDKLDTGTEFILMDRRTGTVIGRQAKDVRGKEVQEAIGADEGKRAAAAPGLISGAEKTISDIAAIRSHPSNNDNVLGGGLGAPGKLYRSIPGTPAYGFNERIEQLKGQTFLTAYNQLRGAGAITDLEGQKAERAMARLNAAQSAKDFNAALDDMESVIRSGVENAKRIGAKHGTVQQQNPAPSQSDAGRVLKYNPATGALE